MRFILRLAPILFAALLATPAFADDWTASKLFGQVLQLVDGQWQPLARGDAVPDGQVVRTLALGRATFTRGQETVALGPNTQIQIFDRGAAKPFTTVKQYFGTVSVEAEVENVQHFAVQTPYLAAVVKGTRFTVTSGDSGASVSVQRGHVEVDAARDHSHVLISVGQSASIDKAKAKGAIVVSGSGKLPVVVTPSGKPVQAGAAADASSASSAAAGSDSASSGGSDNGVADDNSANSGDDGSDQAGSNDNSGKGSSSSGSGNSGNGNSGKDGEHSGKGSSGDSSGSGHDGSGSSGDSSGGDGEDD